MRLILSIDEEDDEPPEMTPTVIVAGSMDHAAELIVGDLFAYLLQPHRASEAA